MEFARGGGPASGTAEPATLGNLIQFLVRRGPACGTAEPATLGILWSVYPSPS